MGILRDDDISPGEYVWAKYIGPAKNFEHVFYKDEDGFYLCPGFDGVHHAGELEILAKINVPI